MDKMAWYVVHAVANSENRVAEELQAQFEKNQLMDYVQEIVVPKRFVASVKRGVKTTAEDRLFPGYVLVKMRAILEVLHVIRNHPRVIGMLGSDHKGIPVPLSEEEVNNMLTVVQTASQEIAHEVHFELGERVKICEGLFAAMEGVIEEIAPERSRLKVSVSIFGRATPVDVEFSQVEKIS